MSSEARNNKFLLENLPEAFAYHEMVWDKEGQPVDYIFREVNAAFEKMTGLSRDRVIGKKVTRVLPGILNSRFDWITVYGEISREKKSASFEEYSEPLNSWFRVIAFSEEEGFFATIFRDISGEKEAQENLKKSEEKYRALIEQSTEMLFLHHQDGQIVEVNEEAVRKTGFSRRELRQMSVFDFHPEPVDREGILSQWSRWEPGGKAHLFEQDHINADGSIMPVEVNTRKVSFGGQHYILALIRDISEGKEVEDRLRSSRENLRITLNSIGDAVIATNIKGQVIRMNRVAEKLTGWDKERAWGRPLQEVFDIFNSRTGEPVENPVEKVLESGKIVGLANHTALISREGQKFQIADSAAPILDEGEEITGVVLVFRDVTREYHLQESLEKNEERLDLALKVANDGMWDWNLKDNQVYFDPRYYTMAGYEPQEFPPSFAAWGERVHPEDIKKAREAIEAHLAGETDRFEIEFRFLRKEGSYMWILGRGQIVEWDEAGQPSRFVGTHTEITKRKKAEQEMENQKNRLSYILEATDVGTWEWNVQTGETIFNEKWAEIVGYSLEELMPVSIATWREFAHPGDLERSEEMLKKHFRGEIEQYDFECRMRHRDGHWVWVQDRGRVISWTAEGEPLWVFGTHLDITQRKRAEQELRENKERLQLMIRNYHDVVIEMDLSGIYCYISPSHEKILGRGAELIGQSNFHLIHSEDRQRVVTAFAHAAESGKEDRQEFRYLHPDRGYIWVEAIGGTIKNQEELSFLITIRDITGRKETEKKIRETRDKIEELHNNTLEMSLAKAEDDVYQLIIDAAEKILKFNICTVDMVEGDYFVVKATSRDMPEGGSTDSPVTEGLAGQCYLEDRTILENDLEPANDEEKPIRDTFRSLISTPIGRLGVFQAVSTSPHAFSQEDVNMAEILISHGAEAITRIRSEQDIRYMSFHDSLTGLYNRTFLEQEINRLDTSRQCPISVIMGDINGLKLVNDAYGHIEGDKLLQKAAEILKKLFRQEDIIARWGGDEFVVLLPQTALLEANSISTRLLDECEQAFSDNVPLSIALGLACKEREEDDFFEILALAEKRMYRNKLSESRSARSAVLTSLIKTLEEKSQETEEHTYRMGKMARRMGEKIGLLQEELNRLELLISLHDIGKIIISEEILNKPGPLNEEEWALIKTHPESGYRIARSTEEISHVAEEILAHHERWDGKGYPRGLSGKDIPLLARINSIVDAYDVMTNGRPYKDPMSWEEAIGELKRCAGSQFDPELIEVFVQVLAQKD